MGTYESWQDPQGEALAAAFKAQASNETMAVMSTGDKIGITLLMGLSKLSKLGALGAVGYTVFEAFSEGVQDQDTATAGLVATTLIATASACKQKALNIATNNLAYGQAAARLNK